jgi:hypothetical protein
MFAIGLDVRSAAHYAIHLQFDISANALVIRAVHSPKCIVRWAVVGGSACSVDLIN